jgi:hypothetical protein
MVFVTNLTRGSVLVDKGQVADNFWTRLKGLIGKRELPLGYGLLIAGCKGVHCMFMSMPIDIIYVDKQDQIVAIDAHMRPWRIGRIYRKSHYVLEVPAGTAQRTGASVGDQLQVLVH